MASAEQATSALRQGAAAGAPAGWHAAGRLHLPRPAAALPGGTGTARCTGCLLCSVCCALYRCHVLLRCTQRIDASISMQAWLCNSQALATLLFDTQSFPVDLQLLEEMTLPPGATMIMNLAQPAQVCHTMQGQRRMLAQPGAAVTWQLLHPTPAPASSGANGSAASGARLPWGFGGSAARHPTADRVRLGADAAHRERWRRRRRRRLHSGLWDLSGGGADSLAADAAQASLCLAAVLQSVSSAPCAVDMHCKIS